jgi:hypothetical protein
MKKFKILTICFLSTASLSTEMVSQARAANMDVAQILYKANKALLRQQSVVNKAYRAVLKAHDNYIENPTSDTYKRLQDTAAADLSAIQDYITLLAQAKKVQTQVEQAKQTFYEETPATKEEIEKGPEGKGTPPGGESVESEIPTPAPQLVEKLKKEINDNGGPQSPFAEQLRKQGEKLKSVKDRIEQEAKTEAVTSNPTAQQESASLVSALQKVIEARRKALGYK